MAETIRAKMPPSQRAKQFAPFDALSGLSAALERKRRVAEAELLRVEERRESAHARLADEGHVPVEVTDEFDGPPPHAGKKTHSSEPPKCHL